MQLMVKKGRKYRAWPLKIYKFISGMKRVIERKGKRERNREKGGERKESCSPGQNLDREFSEHKFFQY